MVKDSTATPSSSILPSKPHRSKQRSNAFKPKSSNTQRSGRKPVMKLANPLKMAYSNMSRSVNTPELLRQRILEFLNVVEKDLLSNLGKLLGSKGLQMVIKHGTKEQQKRVMVQVMTLDIEKVIKSKYAFFFLRKLLKKYRNDKLKQLFLNFFEKGFSKLFKNKQTFKFLELYIENLSPASKLQVAETQLTSSFYDEFAFREFIDECFLKPRLFELQISQLYIRQYFHRLPKQLQAKILEAFLGQLDYVIKAGTWPGIFLLAEMFKLAEFKAKKEVMKKCLKEKFWEYYTLNKYFFSFLVIFLRQINDDKVIKVTLSQQIIKNFPKFFNHPSTAKLLFLLFAKSPRAVFNKERATFPPTLQNLFLTKIENDAVFTKNCSLIVAQLFDDPTALSILSFNFIQTKIAANSQFSLLFGHIFQHFIQTPINPQLFSNLLSKIYTHVSGQEPWLPNSFISSSSGHRFLKRLIQNLSQAHSSVVNASMDVLMQFVEMFKERLNEVIRSRAVFVLLAILENGEVGEELKSFLKQRKGLFNGVEMNPGVKLLKEKLEGTEGL